MADKRKKKKASGKSKRTTRKAPRKRKQAKVAGSVHSRKVKPSRKKSVSKKRKHQRGPSEVVDTVVYEPKGLGARSAGQGGDLQGLSEIAAAESESVSELLEEGNAFEAEVVSGVENVPDADEAEVKTHEVPEDDVPPEYRERD